MNREGHGVDIFVIQKVQDTVIHLEVDEEQWEITQGSKRQAEKTGFLAQYLTGLLFADEEIYIIANSRVLWSCTVLCKIGATR